ncbi:hypothetical protein L7F22_003659 [Adiantum nelumboides]|nr:hypothetical protein [Adiantum nelumboides]
MPPMARVLEDVPESEDEKQAQQSPSRDEQGKTDAKVKKSRKKKASSIELNGNASSASKQSKAEEPDKNKHGEETKNEKEEPTSVSIFKLFSFADGLDYVLILLGTVGSLAHGASLPVFFLYFGNLVNGFGAYQNDPAKMVAEVGQFSLYFVYVGVAVFISSWAEVACWMHTGERQAIKMRVKYLEAILRQDIAYFDTDAETGMLLESVSSDTLLVQDAISEKMGNFIQHLATFLGGFAVGFACVWRLCLVTLAVIPVIAFAGGLYAYTLTKLTSKSQRAYGEAGSIAEQAIAQIRTVYAFLGENKAISTYSETLEETRELGCKGGFAKGCGMGVSYVLLFCTWALILWYAGVLVRRGETNGGKSLTAIFSVIIGGMSLGQAASNLAPFAKGKAAGYKIFEMVSKQPNMDRHVMEDGKRLAEVRGDIELCNVVFSYPSRPDAIIFRNFSLKIPSGRSVAIVGSSGSGKSTVVSLIERFYDPTSGEVLLDGVDIRSLQLKWLRGQIGLVNQEPALFGTTIIQNILYGKDGATPEDVEQAAKAANAHAFISQLPNGYETQVGERGVQLSGGQKQRVAIARAMLKDPKILLLDEATSALDAASESIVQEALDRLMVGRTTVVVAHRLSTIRNVDTIAVVQDGVIVEMGNHEELMAKGNAGAYFALVRLQEMAMASDGTILSRDSRVGILGRLSSSKSGRRSPSLRSNSGRRLSHQLSSGSESRFEFDLQKLGANGVMLDDGLYSVPRGTYWRLVMLNAPEWPYAIVGTTGSVLAGLLNPIFAVVLSEMLSIYYDTNYSRMRHAIQKYSLVYVGAGIASLGIYYVQYYYFGIMGENLTSRVRKMMLSAILRNEVGWFDREENSSARLAARLSTDATNVRAAIGDRLSIIVQNVTVFLTACIVAFVVQWRMALVVLGTFPLLVAAAVAERCCMKGFSGDVAGAHERAHMVSGEAIANIRTVAAFNAEEKVVDLFAQELRVPEKRSLMRGNIAGFFYGISQMAMFSSYGLVLWYGSTLVKNGESTFGPVLKVFMVLMITAYAVAETLSMTPDIVKGGNALYSVFSILDRRSLIDPDEPNCERVTSIKGDIEFRHVEFAYPARPDVSIFKDLSFRVKAGHSLALVGASGSGKSSVISLIERFYDPQAGRVMIDGKDIRKLHLKSLRQHIGLVQQEPALFATTIYDNILYGREAAKSAEVEEAAKAANAHSFITALPEGYATKVGERGVQLSGGQKQRVAIARAVLKDPAILLLDEATSALDAESEKVVQEALDRLMRRRTTVLVAHRLSTIRNASLIAVIQEGKIVEQGSHNELMKSSDGPYARLVNIQQARSAAAWGPSS